MYKWNKRLAFRDVFTVDPCEICVRAVGAQKTLSMFWLLTLEDEASYPSAAMYSRDVNGGCYVNEVVVVYMDILGI